MTRARRLGSGWLLWMLVGVGWRRGREGRGCQGSRDLDVADDEHMTINDDGGKKRGGRRERRERCTHTKRGPFKLRDIREGGGGGGEGDEAEAPDGVEESWGRRACSANQAMACEFLDRATCFISTLFAKGALLSIGAREIVGSTVAAGAELRLPLGSTEAGPEIRVRDVKAHRWEQLRHTSADLFFRSGLRVNITTNQGIDLYVSSGKTLFGVPFVY
ncbi:hypothetical protein SISSUDRAFT_1037048 [Sistotremastrum suecicum HHB10207 ss-3]|uniref:Uncharacterized protein n=1 Tax=Sistotremastrum suecicum HHB10207 ss-3 TaxID=1314776 RepID=A0A165YNX3_9AGAM|nr:hypothetical protein SISSUDRAFT_1037048 [Sistotremastrum suecicum HHB10207 ss-3]